MATFTTTDKNNKPATVRTWSIKQEEWEAGAYLNCRECGCAIRHIVTINGVNFGRDCGLRELGLKVTKATKSTKIDKMYFDLQHAANQAKENHARDCRIAIKVLNGTMGKPMNGNVVDWSETVAYYRAFQAENHAIIAEAHGLVL